LKAYLPFIQNSFIYSFNNGRIEGINNKIKVLNRVAYGYRNFSHYKKHIMIHIKFKTRETKSEKKKTHVKASECFTCVINMISRNELTVAEDDRHLREKQIFSVGRAFSAVPTVENPFHKFGKTYEIS